MAAIAKCVKTNNTRIHYVRNISILFTCTHSLYGLGLGICQFANGYLFGNDP